MIKKEGTNDLKFSRMDLKKYAGKCVALVNGKVVVDEKDPSIAMKRAVALSKKNHVALICVPGSKSAICI